MHTPSWYSKGADSYNKAIETISKKESLMQEAHGDAHFALWLYNVNARLRFVTLSDLPDNDWYAIYDGGYSPAELASEILEGGFN